MTRWLKTGDESALSAYLCQHPDTTVFLRSNLAQAGLDWDGEPYQGQYAAVFDDGVVVGVVARYWNGNIIVSAQRTHIASLARFMDTLPPAAGLLGVADQVDALRLRLGLKHAETVADQREDLMALSLHALVAPPALVSGDVRCRLATQADLPVLAPWRSAYLQEALGMAASEALDDSALDSLNRGIDEARLWVLEDSGELVSMTGFNAALADVVQIGGVWTPPALRGKGYARAAVAGSLLDARAAGVSRSTLFTNNPAAIRAYAALGFERVGDYALVLFA